MSYIPDEIHRNIDEVVHLVRQKGPAFLDHLIMTNRNVPNMSFLFPESPYYPILMDKLNNINQGYPSHSLPNPEQKRSGSRWGAGPTGQFHGNNDHANYPQQYNTNPQMMQGFNPQAQGYNNVGQQPYYNTSPTNYSPGQGNMNQQNYPNYSQSNNPYIMSGSNYSPSSNIPSYLNPSPQQMKSTNERKSSYDKREYNTGAMETEGGSKSKSSRQYTNPEEIPVGMMAEMIRHQSKKFKERNTSHKPYTPLDPEMTPQVIPPVVKVPDSVRTKIDLFYKFISDEKDLDKIAKSKKGTDVDLEIYKSKAQERKKDSFDKKAVGTAEYQQELINSEMGVRSDGRSITGLPSGEERRGLGVQSQDIYSQFRKQRSQTYHVSAEERAATRDLPELCYVCRMPGHIAKDCKFGLN